jgi:hypothetical protein
MALTITVRHVQGNGNENIDIILGKIKGLQSSVGAVHVGFSNRKRHYSGYTMAELARLLSNGKPSKKMGGLVLDYGFVGRPALDQFQEEYNIAHIFRKHIMSALARQSHQKRGDFTMAGAYKEAGNEIKKTFQMWANAGSIEPPNTPYTIKMKGRNCPWVMRGDLVSSLNVSFRPKQGSGLLKVIEGMEE